VLIASQVTKIYGGRRGLVRHQALAGVDLSVRPGEFVGVMGPSGSGKTTLLNILATIDRPTSGTVEVNGVNPRQLRGDRLAQFRRRELGFIFQDYNLLDTLTVRDNIILPLALDRVPPREIEHRLADVAGVFGEGQGERSDPRVDIEHACASRLQVLDGHAGEFLGNSGVDLEERGRGG